MPAEPLEPDPVPGWLTRFVLADWQDHPDVRPHDHRFGEISREQWRATEARRAWSRAREAWLDERGVERGVQRMRGEYAVHREPIDPRTDPRNRDRSDAGI